MKKILKTLIIFFTLPTFGITNYFLCIINSKYKEMTMFKYRVSVPEFVESKINFKTKEFENTNLFLSRELALEYLSEIISVLLNHKVINVSQFLNEDSSEMIEMENLPKIESTDKILDFRYLSECRIQYHYSQKEFQKANELRVSNKMSLKKAFLALGVVSLQIENEQKHFETIFEFRNFDEHLNRFLEETIVCRTITNFKTDDLLNLYSKLHFTLKQRHHEYREIFVKDNNQRVKEIIVDDLFFEFERKLLSIYNRICMVTLFVEEKHHSHVKRAMYNLQSIYGKLKYVYTPKVKINDSVYNVYFFDFKTELKSVYSKEGNYYYRGNDGVSKADEKTTCEEIFCTEVCNDEFIKDLISKL